MRHSMCDMTLAMIIDEHEKHPEHLRKLNHVKGKISHFVEYKLGVPLGRNPIIDAAGPDDFPHLKKVEHRANKANWFKIKALPICHTYQSKPGIRKIIEPLENVLSEEQLASIRELIQSFIKFDMEHAEVIATLYGGWNNLLTNGKQPTDEEIVYESRENWSKRKLTIERKKFFKALEWMKKHKYVPEGNGNTVVKRKEAR